MLYIAGLIVSLIYAVSVNLWFLGINVELIFYAGDFLNPIHVGDIDCWDME